MIELKLCGACVVAVGEECSARLHRLVVLVLVVEVVVGGVEQKSRHNRRQNLMLYY